MPTYAAARETPDAVEADTVAVFASKGDGERAVLTADAAAAGQAVGVDLPAELAGLRFDGELGAVARIPSRGHFRAAVLLVVGLGELGAVTLETLRRAAAVAARNATKDSTLALVVTADLPAGGPGTGGGDQPLAGAAAAAQALIEGAGLGAYAYTTYRTKQHDVPSLERIVLLPGEGVDAGEVERGLAQGQVLVQATALARDLVNTPPGEKRPPALAERFRELGEAAGLTVRVLDEQALTDGQFGGILGVGRGSSSEPRLVELTFEPPGASGHVVLVGKGITFDSGGLSLKPTNSMATMKSDMAGAAAVMAAMTVLRELGVTTKVTGLAALAENMPGGDATRVSDVLTHRGGKTVEVMNTDAEGRLVLGDALAYGAEAQPDAMVDLATLTGAQIVALGPKIAALMGTDDALVEQLQVAARETGEQVWHLPLPPEYAEQLRSPVADLKNIGKPMQAGTLIGGLYLKEFTGDVPWAHLDIAGPAFNEEGESYYTPKGGTGMGVRLLVRFLQSR